jgi:hypothetical protein
MNQGTQGYSLMKKTEGRKSRDTVSLSQNESKKQNEWFHFWEDYRLVDQLVLKVQRKHRKTKRLNLHPWVYCIIYSTMYLHCGIIFDYETINFIGLVAMEIFYLENLCKRPIKINTFINRQNPYCVSNSWWLRHKMNVISQNLTPQLQSDSRVRWWLWSQHESHITESDSSITSK